MPPEPGGPSQRQLLRPRGGRNIWVETRNSGGHKNHSAIDSKYTVCTRGLGGEGEWFR